MWNCCWNIFARTATACWSTVSVAGTELHYSFRCCAFFCGPTVQYTSHWMPIKCSILHWRTIGICSDTIYRIVCRKAKRFYSSASTCWNFFTTKNTAQRSVVEYRKIVCRAVAAVACVCCVRIAEAMWKICFRKWRVPDRICHWIRSKVDEVIMT